MPPDHSPASNSTTSSGAKAPTSATSINDGKHDIIAGPWWWEGPDFKKRHEYYPAKATFELKLGPMTRVDGARLRGDARLGEQVLGQLLRLGATISTRTAGTTFSSSVFPARTRRGSRTRKGNEGHWTRHKIFDQTDNESPTFADLTGDGKPELVCITKGQYGYAEPDWNEPAQPWKFHPISPNNKYGNFTHGHGRG